MPGFSGASGVPKKYVDDLVAQSTAYQVGDVFSSRSWRAMGRVINSGKGIYCWFSMGKPVNATGITLDIGSLNVYGLSGSVTRSGTISSVNISSNTIMFVIDTTSTHTAGEVCLLEFSNTSMTLT